MSKTKINLNFKNKYFIFIWISFKCGPKWSLDPTRGQAASLIQIFWVAVGQVRLLGTSDQVTNTSMFSCLIGLYWIFTTFLKGWRTLHKYVRIGESTQSTKIIYGYVNQINVLVFHRFPQQQFTTNMFCTQAWYYHWMMQIWTNIARRKQKTTTILRSHKIFFIVRVGEEGAREGDNALVHYIIKHNHDASKIYLSCVSIKNYLSWICID